MIRIGADWRVTASLLPGVDTAFIPGLTIDGSNVKGPIDAVATYYRRGKRSKKFRAIRDQAFLPLPKHRRLYDFQNQGVHFIADRWAHSGSAMLTDEMGLGKTAQAIVSARGSGGSVLVVCTRSVVATWQKQLATWWKKATVKVLEEREETSLTLATDHIITIVTYELLQYLTPQQWTTVIIDEAHNFAGRVTLRGKALKQICALATNRLGMTGTEIWSRPRDYWFLFSCLFGNAFGSKTDFDLAYCDGKATELGDNRWISNEGVSRADELAYRVGFYRLRRLKRDVAKQLPSCSRDVRWIDSQPKPTALMRTAILGKMRGAYARALEATLEAKMSPCMDAAQEAQQFLLFTWRKDHAKFMHRTLTERGVKCSLITGETAPKIRDLIISGAAKNGHGIVATLGVASTGVDGLQHVASTGIMHALSFVPLEMLQAEKRLDRIGQRSPVQWIYFLMKESMDVWVNETVLSKLDQWADLIGGGKDEAGSMRKKLGPDFDAKLERETFREIYKVANK